MPAPSLLSHDDRSTILNVQPKPKHSVLGAAVARLFVAHPDKRRWTYTHRFGGLVLVKDTHNNDASFLRIINLSPSGKSVLWEQELYRGFEFTRHAPFFFTVVGDEHVFGLDFADVDEASKFEEKVRKRARKIMKQQQQQQRNSVPNGPSATQRSLNLDDEKYRKLVKALSAYNITESMLDDPNTAKLIKDFVNQNGSVDNMIRSVHPTAPSQAPPPPPTSAPPPPPPSQGVAHGQNPVMRTASPHQAIPPPPPARRSVPPPPPPRHKTQAQTKQAPLTPQPPQHSQPLPPPPPPPRNARKSPQPPSAAPPPPPPRRQGNIPSPEPPTQPDHYLPSAPPMSQYSAPPSAPPMAPPAPPPMAPPTAPPAPPPMAPPMAPPAPPPMAPPMAPPAPPPMAPPMAPPGPPSQAPPPPPSQPPPASAPMPPMGGDSRSNLLASIRGAGGIGALRKSSNNPSSSSSAAAPPQPKSPGDVSPGGNPSGNLTNALANVLAQRNKAIAGDSDSESDDDDEW
ncbi:hypothetical protein LPJ73_001630, partial [Coemansia sp. RSA 2703]